MNKLFKDPWFYFWIAVIVLIIYLVFPKSPPGQYDELASCLTEKGVVMYGTDWCPHCKNQKAMFGNSFKKINYVNCDFNVAECKNKGVTGYPTWIINGESYAGEQSLVKLASLTGCSVN